MTPILIIIILTLGLSAMFIEEFQESEKSNKLRLALQHWSVKTKSMFLVREVKEFCTCKMCGTRFFVTFLNLCIFLPLGWFWVSYDILQVIILNQCLVYFYGLINFALFEVATKMESVRQIENKLIEVEKHKPQ
jgi:hypothetical protein